MKIRTNTHTHTHTRIPPCHTVHYLKGWFLPDLISVIPFGVIGSLAALSVTDRNATSTLDHLVTPKPANPTTRRPYRHVTALPVSPHP